MFCYTHGFDPPIEINRSSICPWLDHSVSGLKLQTYWCPLWTCFRFAFMVFNISFACNNNSLTHYAKGTSSGLWTLRLLVNIRFQDLFHYPVRVSVSPFPHGTSSLSVVSIYFGLEGGPPIFGRDVLCLVLLSFRHLLRWYRVLTYYYLLFQVINIFVMP